MIATIFFKLLLSCSINKSILIDSTTTYPIIKIEEYGVKGIVFADTTDFPFPEPMYPNNYNKRYTPTLYEILLFEKVFHKEYGDFIKQQTYYNPNLEITGETYKNRGRHYYGYLDEAGQRFLFVIFNPLESQEDIDRWKRGPFVMFTAPDDTGQMNVYFNIDSEELLKTVQFK